MAERNAATIAWTDFEMMTPRARLSIRLAAVVLGGVLLVAGLLKASVSFAALYHFGAVLPDGSMTLAMFALAAIEVGASLTLVQRPLTLGTWCCVLLLFSGFFGVALTQAIAGRQVCDCFGAIQLRPLITSAFDFLAIIVCGGVIWKLRLDSLHESVPTPLWELSTTIAAFLATLVALLVVRESQLGDMQFGVPPVVAELQLEPSPSEAVWLRGTALLASRGKEPVRVVGCVQDCGLRSALPLPFSIQPATVTRMPVMVRRPTEASVGIVPLTLFIEVRGSLEKLKLPLLTPRM